MTVLAITGWSILGLVGLALSTMALDVRRGLKNWE